MLSFLFFISSGLFLGWSLGANDASNVFGTAVGTRMIRFYVAAAVCSLFVLLGAVFGGSGAAGTITKLGQINSLGAAFSVSLAAALSVILMTKANLPVSTSQALIGGIIGWNLFAGLPTDAGMVGKVVVTWVSSPFLAAIMAMLLYFLFKVFWGRLKIHILRLDMATRTSLLLAGAFGSYSLGANNIGNVVGVFVDAVPFKPFDLGPMTVMPAQQLFFLGGLAVSAGVFTYSRRVMETVGTGLLELSPPAAFIAVFSHSIVLFLFSSEALKQWLVARNLPSFPLVPVSSSQAIIGAVIGIGFAKNGGRNINYRILLKIFLGWVATPAIALVLSFVTLFLMDRMFLHLL
jgi:PiT family inorganic phosphate transporter